ncbi:MAG TPA: triose-phosphate isomerase [Candidatus Diapherotrites archaeon]|uniref:Triosephosphate isomerase n=1 Tax=Candidatus Iainarchaeum sp. TaxID=3101447 RepID=A0A7J4JJT9_9ARCH|nr:triose-phosphate isomerase [Candidatus Diapherotrites archaeon]HIH16207.1 triose-phosphate isomerase [Candidatus Diapherotrites archaeon]
MGPPKRARLGTPVLFLNFKAYAEATGKQALALARLAEKVARKTKTTIALVVQAPDLFPVSRAVSLPVFAQHLDPVSFGACTGHILPEGVRQAGAKGTILNHAENKRSNDFIQAAIARAHAAGLLVMVCAETTARAREVAAFSPDFVAVEPPELIGGNVSVSTAKPEVIASTVSAVKSVNPAICVITGAGIKSGADVEKALELGTSGVFVASGVVRAASPARALAELCKGLHA